MTEYFNEGANSYVRTDVVNGREVVIKVCRNKAQDKSWVFCAKKEYMLLSLLDKTKLRADVPVMQLKENADEMAIIQTRIYGEYLTEKMFLSLGEKEQQEIVSQIAEVMYAVHNVDVQKVAKVTDNGYVPETHPDKANSEVYFKNDYNGYIHAFDGLIAPQTQKVLDDFIKEKFDGLEVVNTHVAPIHNDIRYTNVFYDNEKQKVGIIDFGGCEVNDIYHDFASISLPNSLGFKAQEMIVEEYNKLLKRDGKDYQISPEMAKAYSVAKMIYFSKMMRDNVNARKKLFPQSNESAISGMEEYLFKAGVIKSRDGKEIDIDGYLGEVKAKMFKIQKTDDLILNTSQKSKGDVSLSANQLKEFLDGVDFKK